MTRHIRVLPDAPRQPAARAKDSHNSRLVSDSNRPLRVLVVDDEPAVAALLEEMVIDAGGESVGIIASALAAIGAAAVIAPDVVLMDVRLPGAMDGIEAAGIIRARGSAGVVVITGAVGDLEIQSRLDALDDIEIVFKPVPERELRDAILRAHKTR
jgi:CheY-like chemotaxis protein